MSENRRIAVIGASRDRRKFGNKCVRAYQQAGWEVLPVNPGTEKVEGLETYASIGEIPGAVDRVALYSPPPRTLRLLPRLPKGPEIFFNPGTADEGTLARALVLGLNVRERCAIVDIGMHPSQFPEGPPS